MEWLFKLLSGRKSGAFYQKNRLKNQCLLVITKQNAKVFILALTWGKLLPIILHVNQTCNTENFYDHYH